MYSYSLRQLYVVSCPHMAYKRYYLSLAPGIISPDKFDCEMMFVCVVVQLMCVVQQAVGLVGLVN